MHSLRQGVPNRPARGSCPPAGPVRSDDLPHGVYYNLSNWVVSHVMAGHDVNAENFLTFIAMTTTHVTVVSLPQNKTNGSSSGRSDRSCGKDGSALLHSLRQCSSLPNAKLELIEQQSQPMLRTYVITAASDDSTTASDGSSRQQWMTSSSWSFFRTRLS